MWVSELDSLLDSTNSIVLWDAFSFVRNLDCFGDSQLVRWFALASGRLRDLHACSAVHAIANVGTVERGTERCCESVASQTMHTFEHNTLLLGCAMSF
jgi:hypothetical protein